MNTIRNLLCAGALLLSVCILPAAELQGPTALSRVFTNNPTVITNGATTFAGTTNYTVDLYQGKGIGFQFSALATNAGQLTFYLTPSQDGTNFTDVSGGWLWGNTLNASGWITRATNIPASITDNYRKLKVTIASNSAAYLVISNANFSRRL